MQSAPPHRTVMGTLVLSLSRWKRWCSNLSEWHHSRAKIGSTGELVIGKVYLLEGLGIVSTSSTAEDIKTFRHSNSSTYNFHRGSEGTFHHGGDSSSTLSWGGYPRWGDDINDIMYLQNITPFVGGEANIYLQHIKILHIAALSNRSTTGGMYYLDYGLVSIVGGTIAPLQYLDIGISTTVAQYELSRFSRSSFDPLSFPFFFLG